jgi:hypothetical protein
MGYLFFIIGPDKILLGADVKGLIRARPTSALLLMDLFLFAWRGLLEFLDLLGVVFIPICHLLPLDGMVLLQLINRLCKLCANSFSLFPLRFQECDLLSKP